MRNFTLGVIVGTLVMMIVVMAMEVDHNYLRNKLNDCRAQVNGSD